MTDVQDILMLILRQLFEHIARHEGPDKAYNHSIKLLVPNTEITKVAGRGRLR